MNNNNNKNHDNTIDKTDSRQAPSIQTTITNEFINPIREKTVPRSLYDKCSDFVLHWINIYTYLARKSWVFASLIDFRNFLLDGRRSEQKKTESFCESRYN